MPKQAKIQNKSNVETALDSHEKICAIRYDNIEKRLESGEKRFARLEAMIIGVYLLIISSQVIAKVL